MRAAAACLLLACLWPAAACAQTAPAVAATSPLLVHIEILEALSSLAQKRGDTFSLQLAEAVTLPDGNVLPAGTRGQGEVVHAEPARTGGKPGELILAARFLDTAQGRFRLHGLRLTGAGKDHSHAALGVALAAEAALPGAALLALFIHGGQFRVPPGTQAIAKLDAVPLPATRSLQPATPGTPTNEEATP